MRGSAHVTHPYRLQIGPGGLTVEPQALNEGPGHPVTIPSERRNPRPLERIRVLLVEDFADARETVRRMLEQEGAVVVEAANAQEGLDRLQREAPDVIVCDIGLPGEDGLALIRNVRALPGPAARVPAVALTAWGMPEDRSRALEAGFQAHLVKPSEPAKVSAVLAALVGRG